MSIKTTCKINGQTFSAKGKNSMSLYKKGLNAATALGFTKALAKTKPASERRQFLIIAIFFQRLCARTPFDEEYHTKHAPNGVHKPDNDYTRYHWYIKMGNNKPVYASDMIGAIGFDVFEKFNDEASIKAIQDYLMKRFEGKKLYKNFYIKNDADIEKFNLLEYGGYKTPRYPRIKKGKKYKHGLKNGHSVQAPAGMMRITKGELLSIVESTAKKPLAYRYRDNSSQKIPDVKKLETIYNTLITKSALNVADIERLLK